MFDIEDTGLTTTEFVARLREYGVLASRSDHSEVRPITHKDASRKDCKMVLESIAEIVVNRRRASDR